jgi:predicted phosphodiesterase
MQLFTRQLPKKCNLYLAGDTHVGSLLTHYDGINQIKESVLSDRNARLIFVGDLCESILTDDNKRFDPTTQDLQILTPMQQYQRFVEIFEPVAKQIVYINSGNHDYKHIRIMDFVETICKQLGVPYGTYTSKLTVQDDKGRNRFKIFTGHGWGSLSSTADDPIRRKSNMKLSLKRKLMNKAADCVLMACGHTHKLIISRPEKELYMTDDGSRLIQNYTEAPQNAPNIPAHLRWYVNTGNFLKNQVIGASGYAERAGYDPSEMGYVKVIIEDWQIADVKKVYA